QPPSMQEHRVRNSSSSRLALKISRRKHKQFSFIAPLQACRSSPNLFTLASSARRNRCYAHPDQGDSEMRPFHLVLPAAAFLSCLSGTKALAQDLPYLDDRSSAATIVKSLYNAVNRKEYARAWDYFGDQKPAKDVEAFAKGYENT